MEKRRGLLTESDMFHMEPRGISERSGVKHITEYISRQRNAYVHAMHA